MLTEPHEPAGSVVARALEPDVAFVAPCGAPLVAQAERLGVEPASTAWFLWAAMPVASQDATTPPV